MFGANSPLKLSKPAAAKTGHDRRLARQLDGRVHPVSGGRRVGGQQRRASDAKRQRHRGRGAHLARLHGGGAQAARPAGQRSAHPRPPADGTAAWGELPADQAWQFVRPPDVQVRDACPPQSDLPQGRRVFQLGVARMQPARQDRWPTPCPRASLRRFMRAAEGDAGRPTAARSRPRCARCSSCPGPLGIPGSADVVTSTLSQAPAGELAARVARACATCRERPRRRQAASPGGRARARSRGACARRHPSTWARAPTLQSTVQQALRAGPRHRATAPLAISADLSAGHEPQRRTDRRKRTPRARPRTPAPGHRRVAVAIFALRWPRASRTTTVAQGNTSSARSSRAAGAPMPGVHITMVDEWGNRADAWSKSGASDAGHYDFPISSDAQPLHADGRRCERYAGQRAGDGRAPAGLRRHAPLPHGDLAGVLTRRLVGATCGRPRGVAAVAMGDRR